MYGNSNTYLFGESAISLRNHKVTVYSFSRAERFRNDRKNEGSQLIQLPSTLNNRAPSQGFGQRWTPVPNRSFSPAPGTYNIPTTLNLTSGPKFRREYPFKNMKLIDPSPGPGTYEVVSLTQTSPKFSFRPRQSLTKYLKSIQNTQTLKQSHKYPKLFENSAYKNTSFTYGETFIHPPNRQLSPFDVHEPEIIKARFKKNL